MNAKQLTDFMKSYFSNSAVPRSYPDPILFEDHEIIFTDDGVVVDTVAIPDELSKPVSEFDDEVHYDTIWFNASPEEREAFRILMRFQKHLLSSQISDKD